VTTALRVGITGGIGSGKSAVVARFAAHGAAVIDSDAIARALTAAGGEAIEAIRAEFGAAVFDAQGALDRPRMRQRIFADPAQRARLEAILHPRILARCLRAAQAQETAAPLLVFDVPLLAEAPDVHRGLRLDRVLVIDCPEELQLARALARGTMPEADVRGAIASQASRARRLALADDVLVNAGTLAALHARVDRLWQVYTGAQAV
jgi:dephospho-CoA kinase